MATTEILAEGKTKIIRSGGHPGEIRVSFKDAATAFNGGKYAVIPGKGELNARISMLLFQLLEQHGIPTCFVSGGDKAGELIYRPLKMIPLEVVVRNYAYGSVCKRFNLVKGRPFKVPLVEFYWKADEADDPQITEDLILALEILPGRETIQQIQRLALEINEIFLRFFAERNIRCADFKLEFGWDDRHQLVLGDELSPDSFRLRDKDTGNVLDKDVFRLDLGDLAETYRELLRRIEAEPSHPLQACQNTYQAKIFINSRKNILNPESKTILESLHHLGYQDVVSLKAGKCFELTLRSQGLATAEKQLRQLAETILSNPVIEDYQVTVAEMPPEQNAL